MTPRTITPPAAEPVSVAEFKVHQRIDEPDGVEDAWIAEHITAARELAESFCNTFFAERTLEVRSNYFEWCGFPLYGTNAEAPARDVVVKYIDTDGVEQTLAPSIYQVLDWQTPTLLAEAWGQTIPSTRNEPGAVRVQYKAGYSMPGESPNTYPMPQSVRAAILLAVGEWYENRENAVIGVSVNTLPLGVERLLWPLRQSLGV